MTDVFDIADARNDQKWCEAREQEENEKLAAVIYRAGMTGTPNAPAFGDLEGHWRAQYERQARAAREWMKS
jgi:hypothetical protein